MIQSEEQIIPWVEVEDSELLALNKRILMSELWTEHAQSCILKANIAKKNTENGWKMKYIQKIHYFENKPGFEMQI